MALGSGCDGTAFDDGVYPSLMPVSPRVCAGPAPIPVRPHHRCSYPDTDVLALLACALISDMLRGQKGLGRSSEWR